MNSVNQFGSNFQLPLPPEGKAASTRADRALFQLKSEWSALVTSIQQTTETPYTLPTGAAPELSPGDVFAKQQLEVGSTLLGYKLKLNDLKDSVKQLRQKRDQSKKVVDYIVEKEGKLATRLLGGVVPTYKTLFLQQEELLAECEKQLTNYETKFNRMCDQTKTTLHRKGEKQSLPESPQFKALTKTLESFEGEDSDVQSQLNLLSEQCETWEKKFGDFLNELSDPENISVRDVYLASKAASQMLESRVEPSLHRQLPSTQFIRDFAELHTMRGRPKDVGRLNIGGDKGTQAQGDHLSERSTVQKTGQVAPESPLDSPSGSPVPPLKLPKSVLTWTTKEEIDALLKASKMGEKPPVTPKAIAPNPTPQPTPRQIALVDIMVSSRDEVQADVSPQELSPEDMEARINYLLTQEVDKFSEGDVNLLMEAADSFVEYIQYEGRAMTDLDLGQQLKQLADIEGKILDYCKHIRGQEQAPSAGLKVFIGKMAVNTQYRPELLTLGYTDVFESYSDLAKKHSIAFNQI